MKTTINTIILAALSALFFTSCEKTLDLYPKDQYSDISFWKVPSDFQLAGNELYFSLMTVPQYIDRNSDIAFGNGPDKVSNGSYLVEANSKDHWDDPYKYIRSANYLLQKSRESTLGAAIDRPVGEAYFFRAYNYWKLVKIYGGIPKIEIVLDVTSPELYTPKSTQAEIIDFILQDLDSAIAKLPKQSELSSDDLGRATKGAALALKARAALYQGTWAKYHGEANATQYIEKAVDAANKAVESAEYDLYNEKGAESYKYLFILDGDDSKEVILARRYYSPYVEHNYTRELWFNAMIPTKNLADMYLATDGLPITKSTLFHGYAKLASEFENRDPRMAMTFVVPGSLVFSEGGVWVSTYPGFVGSSATRTGYLIRKFLGETLDDAQFRCSYDFKEFRYGEVLLILAEALYEKNEEISDGDLNRTINRLRTRVNMPPLTNSFVQANGLNMLDEIRRERTVELAFEGYRRDDLRRWKMAETILPGSIKGVKFVGTEFQQQNPNLKPGFAPGESIDIIVDEEGFIVADPSSGRQFTVPKHYFDPIPSQQIQLSKGTLEQNPGW